MDICELDRIAGKAYADFAQELKEEGEKNHAINHFSLAYHYFALDENNGGKRNCLSKLKELGVDADEVMKDRTGLRVARKNLRDIFKEEDLESLSVEAAEEIMAKEINDIREDIRWLEGDIGHSGEDYSES